MKAAKVYAREDGTQAFQVARHRIPSFNSTFSDRVISFGRLPYASSTKQCSFKRSYERARSVNWKATRRSHVFADGPIVGGERSDSAHRDGSSELTIK